MEKGNAVAYYQLARYYTNGDMGLPQDMTKTHELYLKAGELGCDRAYYNLGINYQFGNSVESDMKKAKHYYELAAMNGDVNARNNLGAMEGNAGNLHRAMKHFILAASVGQKHSLDAVKWGFMNGYVTKDEYANTLRSYQKIVDEMKSEARDKAEAVCT